MNGKPITIREINKIKSLRRTGHSLPEICRTLGRGGSTVYKFVKDVKVLPKYINILKEKQGGSKKRATESWSNAKLKACNLLKNIGKRDKLLILASIYWGEGTKSELNIINSDPELIKIFISCLKEIGINKNSLKVSIRIYDDIGTDKAKQYWAKICNINPNSIKVNILAGKKIGKLPYGMCRIRVARGGEYFKLIISMINFIKLQLS